MTSIIQDLLDFARTKPLSRQRVRVGDIVDNAVTLIAPLGDDHNVDIVVVAEAGYRGSPTKRSLPPGSITRVSSTSSISVSMAACHSWPWRCSRVKV